MCLRKFFAQHPNGALFALGITPWFGWGCFGWLIHIFGYDFSPPNPIGTLIFCSLMLLLVLCYEVIFHAYAEEVVHVNSEREIDNPDIESFLSNITGRGVRTAIGTLFHTPKERLDHLVYILNRLQSRIGDEYTDITSRVTWLMTGQAFLISAFMAIADAERLAPDTQYWLAIGITVAGWVISFNLHVSTSLGHALIEKLKSPRDDLEKFMAKKFRVPRAGVRKEFRAHKIGHAATRYLPPFSHIAWAGLTVLVLTGHILPDNATSHAGFAKYSELPPAFPMGSVVYHEKPGKLNKHCPDSSMIAESWARAFLENWSKRPFPSTSDTLIIIGSADRTELSDAFKKRGNSNMSLARGRAETIKDILKRASAEEVSHGRMKPRNQITDANAIVLITAPRNLAKTDAGVRLLPDCTDPELAADRTVEIWTSKTLPP